MADRYRVSMKGGRPRTLRFTCRAFNLETTQALHESGAIRGQVQALVRHQQDAAMNRSRDALYFIHAL